MGSRVGVAVALFILVVAASVAGTARAQCGSSTSISLTDGTGYIWDTQLDGAILNGTGDAFDTGMVLVIDGTYFPVVTAGTTEVGGRQVAHGPMTMSGLTVTRRVLVPAGEGWARFLEYLDNPTGAAITVTVRIETNPGSDSSTMVTGSESGDTIFTTADRWVTTDDSTTSGDPSLCHLYWGTGARSLPTMVGMTVFDCATSNGVWIEFPVTVPAGGRAIVMHFGSQSGTSTDAIASCTSLSTLPASTIGDLSASDRAAIVNWGAGGTMGLPLGSACTSGTQCTSGFCTDGVCCNVACAGGSADCTACSTSAGAPANGTCATIPGCGDAGVPDAGPRDAGPRDAGAPRDSGIVRDAGTFRDSSVPRVDSGPRPDGSTGFDSGVTRLDAGLRTRSRTRDRGCCSTVPDPRDRTPGALAFAALLLLVALRRARRRR